MSRPGPLNTPSALRDIEDAHSLMGGHARLMRDVARRAAPVLALLKARVWPHAELGALTAFLRTSVLRQISDEEVHLFPNNASLPPFAGLATDHVRLRSLTARLEKAYAQPCSPGDLRGLVHDLLDTLRRHLDDEQQVLHALRIDLDQMTFGQRHKLRVSRPANAPAGIGYPAADARRSRSRH